MKISGIFIYQKPHHLHMYAACLSEGNIEFGNRSLVQRPLQQKNIVFQNFARKQKPDFQYGDFGLYEFIHACTGANVESL